VNSDICSKYGTHGWEMEIHRAVRCLRRVDLFFGDDSSSFAAVDARSGYAQWESNTGDAIHASPMSYEVDGTQYVAIAAAYELFAFFGYSLINVFQEFTKRHPKPLRQSHKSAE
jgi:hypothetical protein